MEVGSWAEDQTQFSDRLTSNRSISGVQSPTEPDSGKIHQFGSEANPRYRKFSMEEQGPGPIRQHLGCASHNNQYKIEISPNHSP